ncbi:hypothetical protein [Oligoflexus tunisiensis]|uniref:hypothetical protein n=1 Tax=Oligoflexus tunisiensis TaxID=708132 RepID=UPI00114C9D29|nr:hypothetical protein [Oligoflexus tunisiensis]
MVAGFTRVIDGIEVSGKHIGVRQVEGMNKHVGTDLKKQAGILNRPEGPGGTCPTGIAEAALGGTAGRNLVVRLKTAVSFIGPVKLCFDVPGLIMKGRRIELT